VTAALSTCKVLLVDDIKENINVLVQALKDDYKLGFALDGKSALKYAQTQKPDLILLDIMMQGMDGFEVSRRLKSDDRTKDIPFIFITAIDEIENKTAGFELGAVDYITKPFEVLEVKARVQTHLSLLVARRQLAKQNKQMRHSLSLAMEVQQNLIPANDPENDEFDIAGQTIYCDETGGDYYDYLEMTQKNSECLAVVVGDVSGHGIPSALLMASARAFLRQRASLPGSVAQIVTDVNRQFSMDVKDSGQFMTLIFCCLDIKEKRVTWSRAGHDPAILYDPRQKTFSELIQIGGLPLGISENTEYEELNLDIKAGSIMVLFSDGITESRDGSGGFYGKERIKQVVQKQADKSSREIRNAIVKSVEQFSGRTAKHDDATIVVIKAKY
jgi:sigma-B regulation protein RsbU (phosphoserine phosphatase)